MLYKSDPWEHYWPLLYKDMLHVSVDLRRIQMEVKNNKQKKNNQSNFSHCCKKAVDLIKHSHKWNDYSSILY